MIQNLWILKGLWYTDNYSENDWLSLWQELIKRYLNNKYVIGCDLRNELRQATVNGVARTPTWGTQNAETDWRQAAIKCAETLLKINPNLLMFIEGIDYALNLQGISYLFFSDVLFFVGR